MSNLNAPLIDAAETSPCIGICRLDAWQLCVGCRRTMNEIVEWPYAGAARRREILRELALRPASPEIAKPGR